MKKIIPAFLLLATMAFSACQKDDEAPIIILSGDLTETIELNSTWTDPGFTVSDDQDGDITDQVVIGGDAVDADMAGTYEITYSVSDKAGNSAEKFRTVYVVNSALNRGGLYNVTDTTDFASQTTENYQVQIIPSLTENNVCEIQNFRNKGNTCKLKIRFDNITMILVDSQRPDLGAGNEGDVSGAGQVQTNQTSLRIAYLINYDAGGSDTGVMWLDKN